MIKRLGVFMFCVFTMVNMTFGQDKSIIQMIDEGGSTHYYVQPIMYTVSVGLTSEKDNTDRVEYMSLSKREKGYECTIKFKNKDSEKGDFWSFDLINTRDEEDQIVADLSDLLMKANRWMYVDDKAFGTYKYNKISGEETLTIHYHFHTYNSESVYTISWKKLKENNNDE